MAFEPLKKISELERYVALVIEFDPVTGWRAGGIRIPEDTRKFFCLPLWQDVEKGIEMRIILDPNVNPADFIGLPGIEVVEGKEAINAKARELFQPRYSVYDRILFRISLQDLLEKGIVTLKELSELTWQEQLAFLHKKGCLGIRKVEPYQIPL